MAVTSGPSVRESQINWPGIVQQPQSKDGKATGPQAPGTPGAQAEGQPAPGAPPAAPAAKGTPGTAQAKQAEGTQAPKPNNGMAQRLQSDGVEKGGAKKPDTSALGEPTLPESDATVTGMGKQQQQTAVEALVGTLTDVVKEFATTDGLKQIAERATELQANPGQSLFGQLLAGDAGAKLLSAMSETGVGNAQLLKLTEERMGPEAAQFLQNYLSQVQSYFIAVISTPSTPDKPVFGLTESQMEKGMEQLKEIFGFATEVSAQQNSAQRLKSEDAPTVEPPVFETEWKVEDGTAPPASEALANLLSGKPTLGPDGKPLPMDQDAIKTVLNQIMATGEAGLEFLIGLAGKLAQGDQVEHLKLLQASLQVLKEQKLGLMNKIIGKEAEMQGSEFQGAVQAEEARKAAESARNCAIVGAVFAVIAAIAIAVIAVVVAIASFGAASAASAAAIVGAVSLAAAATAAATATAMAVVAVCAVVAAVMTIVAQMPNLMRAIALIMKEAGLDGMAQSLNEAADWYEKNITSQQWFQILNMAVMCTAGLVSAVASFGATGAINVATACVTIASAAASAGVAVGTYSATKAMIEAQYAVTLLKGQLAKVEVAIKQLMNQLAKLRGQEDAEQKRVQESEETLEQIMKNVQACADKLSEIRTSVSEV